MNENINEATINNEIQTAATETVISKTHHHHHHSKKSNPVNTVTNAAKENPMATGILLGAGVSIPVTALVTCMLQKRAWLKAAADFDAAVASGAATV